MILPSAATAGTASPRSHPHEHPAPAITRTEFLPDCVRVHFFCHRPWGMLDEQSMVELPYAGIPALPALPMDHGHGEFRETWDEAIYLRPPNATIIFRFVEWQETDDCRMEALLGGPYLAPAGETGGGNNLNPS
jgi:hypothetical protein